MAKIDLLSKDWCDIVFEGRNKAYGAYELRANAGSRNIRSVIIIVVVLAFAVSLPALINLATPEKSDQQKMTEVAMLSKLQEAKVKDKKVVKRYVEKQKKIQHIKSSLKYTAPVIKKDEEVHDEDQLKSQDELSEAKGIFSSATVAGNDDEHGQDIADIKEVLTTEASEKVFNVVEQMPSFPGGQDALNAYITSHLRYPSIALEQEIQGGVKIRFVVDKTGKVQQAEVVKSLDRSCDKEAIRVINSLPRFIPGKQQGRAVPVFYTLTVRFRLE